MAATHAMGHSEATRHALLHMAVRRQLDLLERSLVVGQWRWPGEAQRQMGQALGRLVELELALWPVDMGAAHVRQLWVKVAEGHRDSAAELTFALQIHRRDCLLRLANEALAGSLLLEENSARAMPAAPPPRPDRCLPSTLIGDHHEPTGRRVE